MIPFVSPLWKRLPLLVRQLVILLTQTSFSVGVSAVVLDEAERVLLFRHYMRTGEGWGLPGGFVGRGESLEAALRRELQEEAKLDIDVVTQLEARVAELHHLDVCYLARIKRGTLEIDASEVRAGKFFPTGALPADLGPGPRRMIDLALQRMQAGDG